jgi:hypothetical protein
LITLLEVQLKKNEERSQVIDITVDDKAPSDGLVIQGGEYKFLTLDNDYLNHPSKVEGRKIGAAGNSFS